MPNFMFWALAAANANPGPRTPTSPDAMATAPVVIAGTYVDAIQPVVVSGMPLAGATPEQQQMPVVVVAGTYVRAQSRELARGIGSVQRGIARQLSGASSIHYQLLLDVEINRTCCDIILTYKEF